MIWNWLRRHPSLVDGAIVVALLAIYVGAGAHREAAGPAILLGLVSVLPLLVRRRWPLATLAIVTGATIVLVAGYALFIPFALAVGIYTVAAHVERRRSLIASAAALLALAPALLDSLHWSAVGTSLRLSVFALAWVVGDNLRTRRAYYQELEEKAERLERERQAETARAAAEEQARIARELHDVIAHSLSVMVVQAAAARDVFDAAPERARASLAAIESTGRSALGELRRVLGVVRGEYEPLPSLEGVHGLIDTVRAAGLDVDLTVDGDPYDLPASVDLSAYRVVQEALTNTLKHARAQRAHVAIRYDDDLIVEVRDDGIGSANGSTRGQGLAGMRERATMLGGTLETVSTANEGFVVRARFPSMRTHE